MVDTILTAVGDAAALAAALCAYLALGKANETIKQAKAARLDAEQAARDAAAERRQAERDRERHRIEQVGEIVEAVAFAAGQGSGRDVIHRNRLRQALVGLQGRLPACLALVVDVKNPDQLPATSTPLVTRLNLSLSPSARNRPKDDVYGSMQQVRSISPKQPDSNPGARALSSLRRNGSNYEQDGRCRCCSCRAP